MEHLDRHTLIAYTSSSLEEQELARVERHLAECEFCRDAAEGFALVYDPQVLEETGASIRKKAGLKSSNAWTEAVTPLRAAAAVLILALTGFTLYTFILRESSEKIVTDQHVTPAQERQLPAAPPKETETDLPVADSQEVATPPEQAARALAAETPEIESELAEISVDEVTEMAEPEISDQVTNQVQAEKKSETVEETESDKEEHLIVSGRNSSPPAIGYNQAEYQKSSAPASVSEDASASTAGRDQAELSRAAGLLNQQPQAALAVLDSLIKHAPVPVNQQASLQKAYWLIAQGRNEDAIKTLKQMNRKSSPVRNRARAVLDSLNRN